MGEYEIVAKQKTLLTLKQAKSLTNYILLEPQNYDKITIGSYIRYINEDGKFIMGGKVITVSKTKIDKGSRDYLVIKPHNSRLNTYIVFLDKVKNLWKRIEYNIHPEFAELQKKIMILDQYLTKRDGQQYIDFVRDLLV